MFIIVWILLWLFSQSNAGTFLIPINQMYALIVAILADLSYFGYLSRTWWSRVG
jgi:hypothetical protein